MFDNFFMSFSDGPDPRTHLRWTDYLPLATYTAGVFTYDMLQKLRGYRVPKQYRWEPYDPLTGKKSTFFQTMPAVRRRGRGGGEAPPTPPKRSRPYPSSIKGTARKLIADRKARAAKKENMPKKGSKPQIHAHETGYVGSFGKVKKQKRRFAEKFDKYGAVKKYEKSFIQTSSEAAYVGHGYPTNEGVRMVIYAVLRSLLTKAGIEVDSWESNNFLQDHRFTFYHTINDNDGVSVDFLDITAGTNTFNWVGGQLYDKLVNLITSDTSTYHFQSITLSRMIGTDYVQLASLNLNNYFIDIDYYSILKVKNISLASDGSITVQDSQLANNIAAQPLVGRLYKTDKWCNGFRLEKAVGKTGESHIFADSGTGIISQDSVGLSGSNNTYNKPPPGYALGTKMSSVVRLNPGELKVDVLKWRAKMKFNTFIMKNIWSANSYFENKLRDFGAAKVIGMEREVEIGPRGEATGTVRLAAEVTWVLKVVGRSVVHKVAPLIEIAPNAI